MGLKKKFYPNNFGSKKKKNWPEKNFRSEKNFSVQKNLGSKKKVFGKKTWGPKKKFWVQNFFGKHRLCATIRFLLCSLIVDFGGVLLVTWLLSVGVGGGGGIVGVIVVVGDIFDMPEQFLCS